MPGRAYGQTWLPALVLAAALAACTGMPHSGATGHRTPVRPPPTASRSAKRSTTRRASWSVAGENLLPGTTAWRLRSPGPADAIEGYANRVSVLPGRPFRLYVSTTARRFRAVAYRMGWYGGRQGREVWVSGWVRGRRQPAARVSSRLHTVSARWRLSLTVPTRGWPVGDYLVELVSGAGHERYVPITVRSASTRGEVVLLNAVTTWQAYNTWGGYDLYRGPGGSADRSRAVSFDRPYGHTGIERFLAFERPAVALAERLGLHLGYLTDTDLAAHPGILRGARALVSLGHDEYWSGSMRRAAMRARAAGTNIAFLGANAVYRHVRLAPTRLGPDRLVICYKYAAEDPMSRMHPAAATQDWDQPPDPRPESVLTGVMYDCFPADAPYVVVAPRSWVFARTGARRGTRFAHLVGPESDRLDLRLPTPRPLRVLSDVPFSCGGRPTWSNSAYYTARSGAGVFDTGTMRWVPALGHSHRVSPAAWRFVRRTTANVLRAFAAGPAGRTHPAHDDARRYSHGTG